MDEVSPILNRELSGAAFRRLVKTGAPAPISALAADLSRPEPQIDLAVEELKSEGGIQVDDQGRVVGAAGLSIGPDRHRIELGRRTFWT